jgi:hypothetical protein
MLSPRVNPQALLLVLRVKMHSSVCSATGHCITTSIIKLCPPLSGLQGDLGCAAMLESQREPLPRQHQQQQQTGSQQLCWQ